LAGAVATFPARLHVILARETDEAVIIRRGPSKTTCVIGWNRRHDTFNVGQWMRGRIYERRCDLSPDGRYLIYFAMNGRWNSETRGAWTAISRAPYVKALALFPKGDCWHGGGLFTAQNRYWLNDGYGHATLHDDARIVRDRKYELPGYYGGECLTVYYNRLERDGWAMRSGLEEAAGAHVVFEKSLGDELILRKYCFSETGAPPGKGCYYDRHEIVRRDGATLTAEADWEWADCDGVRLVWAEHGILYAARIKPRRLEHAQVLHDFNLMTFEAIAAPY
jgi:hypothetical protein